MKLQTTTSNHQQANGKVEKFIQFLTNTLATEAKTNQSNWCSLLDSCLFTYRVSLNRTLNDNPFYLIYGRDAVLPQDLFLPITNNAKRVTEAENIVEYKNHQLRILQDAYARLNKLKSQERVNMKNYYDKTHKDKKFNINDLVMVFTPITKIGFSKTLLPKWRGPYRVIAQVNLVNYRLESLKKNEILVKHVNSLSKFIPWCDKGHS